MIRRDAVAHGGKVLGAAGVDDPERDAQILLAHCLDVPRHHLAIEADMPLSAQDFAAFETLLAARAKRQPVSQILGKRAFWEHEFQVTGDVLDPRPETEHLVELALNGPAPKRVLDLGTGSGCIVISVLAACHKATGLGTDISQKALDVAKANAARIGVAARLDLVLSNWFDNVRGRFDLILCNPPYIAQAEMDALAPEVRDWEPHLALTPGEDGLEPYALIAKDLNRFLTPGGQAHFECGVGQTEALIALFSQAGFQDVTPYCDLSGRARGISLVNAA